MTHHFFWAATGGSSLTPCLPLSVLPSVINPVLFQITCQRGRPPQPTPCWTQQSSGFVQQQQVASKSGLCHLSEPCRCVDEVTVSEAGIRGCVVGWVHGRETHICLGLSGKIPAADESIKRFEPTPRRHTSTLWHALLGARCLGFFPFAALVRSLRQSGWTWHPSRKARGLKQSCECVWLWLNAEKLYTVELRRRDPYQHSLWIHVRKQREMDRIILYFQTVSHEFIQREPRTVRELQVPT